MVCAQTLTHQGLNWEVCAPLAHELWILVWFEQEMHFPHSGCVGRVGPIIHRASGLFWKAGEPSYSGTAQGTGSPGWALRI